MVKKRRTHIIAIIIIVIVVVTLNLFNFFYGNELERYWIFKKSTLKAEYVEVPSLELLAPESTIPPDNRFYFNVSGPHEYGKKCIDTCPYYSIISIFTKYGDKIGVYYADGLDVEGGQYGYYQDEIRWSLDSQNLYLLYYEYTSRNMRELKYSFKISIPK